MKKHLATLMLAIGMSVSLLAPSATAAPVDVFNNSACKDSTICKGDPKNNDVYNIIGNIVQILIAVTGIVSVIMIVIGGITYATSAGDPSQTKRGKDTVIYAVVGLVVAIMAYAIVGFVLGRL